MEIKTEFNEFTVTVKDAEFKLKEADTSEFFIDGVKIGKDNTSRVSMSEALNCFAKKCILDWKNVKSKGVDLPCTEENKGKLPMELKQTLFMEVFNRSGL